MLINTRTTKFFPYLKRNQYKTATDEIENIKMKLRELDSSKVNLILSLVCIIVKESKLLGERKES